MKFSEFEYVRPNIKKMQESFDHLLNKFVNANTFEEQDEIIANINDIRSDFESNSSLVYVRNTINTNDKFYEEEKKFMDENSPLYEELVTKYYKALMSSKFEKELREKWGNQIFDLADKQLKTFKKDIIDDLMEENKLKSEYTKLLASAKIDYKGQIRNLSQMIPFIQSKDREQRKEAYEAQTKFFEENEEKFDEIYDDLVKLRTKIAKKLGYKNFVELGYNRLSRTDYDSSMVEGYRNQIINDLVPLATKLKEMQKERLNIDKLYYYDEPLTFLDGNATPKGDANWILDNGKKMYSLLSSETKEFFDFMMENETMDLLTKEGKAAGGYCTYISKYQTPFIFSNFNGTSGDIDVLTHEAGHAFQMYQSRHYKLPEYQFPTLEACEIHSMSMEFLTWPHMELFFKEDTKKYKFAHLTSSITFIPYGALVDEFQHVVYENPDMTPKERKQAWRELEQKYLPHRDYFDNEFLKAGGYWFRQGHIFKNPFYYIDYTLAQVCALQFFSKANIDFDNAFKDYLQLCKKGGSMPFLQLVKSANLNNPFVDGTIKETLKVPEKWLLNNIL